MLRSSTLIAIALLVAGCGAPAPLTAPPHGVVLVVLDTLRADGLSAYGNPRKTSPTIDSLARDGVLFETVVSNSSWTLPAFVGLLSGAYPSERIFAESKLQSSLVEAFRKAGFATAAFTEGGMVSDHFGMDRGFDTFWQQEARVRGPGGGGRGDASGGRGARHTFDAAIAWLREQGQDPFLLMVHTYEVHTPYIHWRFARDLDRGAAPLIYRHQDASRVSSGQLQVGPKELQYVRALYDGGVRSADFQVQRLLDALRELGLEERTVIAVTSDHGEHLGERDPKRLGVHGGDLYEPVLRIPLVIRDPRLRYPVKRVPYQVRLIDVMPTLLDLAAIELPEDADGRSLVPLMLGREAEDRVAFGHVSPWRRGASRATIRDGRYKLIDNGSTHRPGVPALELYDLRNDPQEATNLANEHPDQRQRMAVLLEQQRAEMTLEGEAQFGIGGDVPDALRRQLEKLGYLR